MLPLAALARVAASGAMEFGAAEAGAARAGVAARGTALRNAGRAAGGNKEVAQEMIQRRGHELRQQEQAQRKNAEDEAREQARQQKQQAQEAERQRPALFKGMRDAPHATAANVSTGVIQGNYRGLAASALPTDAGNVLQALGRLTDAIESRGREIAPFSGGLMGKVVDADMRKMNADIYEAKVAGDSYGRVIEESSKLQTGLENAFAPVKAVIADGLADLMVLLQDWMPDMKSLALGIRDTLIVMKDYGRELPYLIAFALNDQEEELNKFLKLIAKKIEQDIEESDLKMAKKDIGLDWFNDPLLLQPHALPAGPVPGNGAADRFGFGIFGGF